MIRRLRAAHLKFEREENGDVDMDLQGKVFVERLSNIKRAFLKRRLKDIEQNKIRTDYKMIK